MYLKKVFPKGFAHPRSCVNCKLQLLEYCSHIYQEDDQIRHKNQEDSEQIVASKHCAQNLLAGKVNVLPVFGTPLFYRQLQYIRYASARLRSASISMASHNALWLRPEVLLYIHRTKKFEQRINQHVAYRYSQESENLKWQSRRNSSRALPGTRSHCTCSTEPTLCATEARIDYLQDASGTTFNYFVNTVYRIAKFQS